MQPFKIILALLYLVTSISTAQTIKTGTAIKGPALVEGATLTTSSAGTTALTKDSETKQILTGTLSHSITLPSATTIPISRKFVFINKSTGTLTIKDFGGNTLSTVNSGDQKEAHLRVAGSTNGTWDIPNYGVSGTTAWGALTGTLSDQTDLQAALNLKAPLASPSFTGTIGTLLTSSRALVTDGSSNLSASAITSTELGRLSGLLSNVVGVSDQQIVTNKDIDFGTASNANRVTLPKNTLTNLQGLTRKQGTLVYDTTSNKPYYDDGSNLKVIGSGSGGAGNLIDDGDAEAGITNFVEGSYSAATRPAGTFTASSGAGSFAISTTATTPLFGNTSFLLTKSSGTSRQGRAIERTIAIDSGYRTKMLKTRIDYTIVSGSFVAGNNTTDSSLIWYVGQFNGSTWSYTEPSTFKMFSNSTTNSDWVEGEFQVNSDTTQLKLIAYVAETANSAWVVKAEVGIKPSVFSSGPMISTFQSYTPSNTQGFGTVTAVDLRWAQKADTLSIEGGFTSGTVTGSIAQLALPNGLVIGGTTGKRYHVGELIRAGGTRVTVFAIQGNNYLTFGGGASSQGDVIGSSLVGNAEVLLISASEIPIQGWSSSTQVSDGYDGRSIVFSGTQTSESLTANTTNITFAIGKDNAASWSTNTFTVKSAGDYLANASGVSSAIGAALSVYKNGTLVGYGSSAPASGSATAASVLVRDCVAGDVISFRSSVTTTLTAGVASIFKLQAPTTISATSKFSFVGTGATSSSVGSNTVVKFNTIVEDTFGCWNATNGDCAVQNAGTYHVECGSRVTHTGASVNQYIDVKVQIDTVDKREFVKYLENTGIAALSGVAVWQGPLTSGQKIRCVTDTNLTSPVLTTFDTHTFMNVMQIK